MFDHFFTLCWKGVNYNFQVNFKGFISIILCKTLALSNVKTLQLKKSI